MNSDNINPMTELERLFNGRRLCLARKTDYEETIKSQQAQLDKTAESLRLVTAVILDTEQQIKNQAKKL